MPIAPVGYNAMLTNYVAADERFIVCPNQDVVYGGGFTALDKEPTVFQVPDFGDRFWVYALYDQRTDEIGQFGKQYGTEPGFYMIVGRDWQGEVPQGIKGVVRSSTDAGLHRAAYLQGRHTRGYRGGAAAAEPGPVLPAERIRRADEDQGLEQTPAFPGAEGSGGGETAWVKPETYFDELPVVMGSAAAAG